MVHSAGSAALRERLKIIKWPWRWSTVDSTLVVVELSLESLWFIKSLSFWHCVTLITPVLSMSRPSDGISGALFSTLSTYLIYLKEEKWLFTFDFLCSVLLFATLVVDKKNKNRLPESSHWILAHLMLHNMPTMVRSTSLRKHEKFKMNQRLRWCSERSEDAEDDSSENLEKKSQVNLRHSKRVEFHSEASKFSFIVLVRMATRLQLQFAAFRSFSHCSRK